MTTALLSPIVIMTASIDQAMAAGTAPGSGGSSGLAGVSGANGADHTTPDATAIAPQTPAPGAIDPSSPYSTNAGATGVNGLSGDPGTTSNPSGNGLYGGGGSGGGAGGTGLSLTVNGPNPFIINQGATIYGGAGGTGGEGGVGGTDRNGVAYDGGGGGGGGGGGRGAVLGDGTTVINYGTIYGGNGGMGGNGGNPGVPATGQSQAAAGANGSGGDGGIGVDMGNGSTLTNALRIQGGNGGDHAPLDTLTTTNVGVGGVGIVGSNATIINSRTISGGTNIDSTDHSYADAIRFLPTPASAPGGTPTASDNRLELQQGWAIQGNVVGAVTGAVTGDSISTNTSKNTLTLGGYLTDLVVDGPGGSTHAGGTIFDVSWLAQRTDTNPTPWVASHEPQYFNFNNFEKTGTGLWQLTNSVPTLVPYDTSWTIYEGTLQVGSPNQVFGNGTSIDIKSAGTLDLNNISLSGTHRVGDVTNAGTINFGTTPGTTLEVNNYIGAGGTINFNTVQQSDSSYTSDLLRVNGSSTGSSYVNVVNYATSLGYVTTNYNNGNGILLVDVVQGPSNSSGSFTLKQGSRIASGAIEYELNQVNGDWYLQSVGSSGPGDPGDPGDPNDPGHRHHHGRHHGPGSGDPDDPGDGRHHGRYHGPGSGDPNDPGDGRNHGRHRGPGGGDTGDTGGHGRWHRYGGGGTGDWGGRGGGGGNSGRQPRDPYRTEVPTDMAIPHLVAHFGLAMINNFDARPGFDDGFGFGNPYDNSGWADRSGNGRGNGAGSCNDGRSPAYVKARRQPCADNRAMGPRFWGRVLGETGSVGNRSSDFNARFQDFKSHGPSYDFDLTAIQIGVDLAHTMSDIAGAYVGVGRVDSTVDKVYGGKAGTVGLDGYSLGGYWTHRTSSGFYTDAILQSTWYENIRAQSVGNTNLAAADPQTLKTNGWGIAASLQAGYPIALGGGLVLDPQAQFIYQHISLKGGADSFGLIQFSDIDAFYGRIGGKLTEGWVTGGGVPIKVWGITNLWHQFGSDATTTFSNLSGTNPVALNTGLGGTWVQLGLGVSGQVTQNVSVFGAGEYNITVANGEGYSWGGKAGVKVGW